jgi:syringomycin synthetase protein SyrE
LVQNGTPVRALILIDTIYPRVLVGGANLWRFLGWLVRRLHLHELSLNGRRLGALFNDPGLVAQIMAMRGYRPQAFDGTTLMISTSGLKRWDYWLFRPWRKLMPKRLTQLQVPGLHGSIFEQDNITELASSLSNIFVLSHDRPS